MEFLQAEVILRVLAIRLGSAAVQALIDGHTNMMVGVINDKTELTLMKNTLNKKKSLNYELLDLAKVLSK